MKRITTALFTLSTAAVLLTGCTKKGEPGPAGATGATGATGPTGPSGQNLTGTVYGFVNPVDENGSNTTLAKSGVTVTLEGATTLTATTDANGRYEFPGVRNGTYNMTYSRTGLATLRRFAVTHVGGDQPTFLGLATLSQVSNTVAGNLVLGSPTATSIPLTMLVTNPNPATNFRVSFFASTTPGVTSATGTLVTTFILTNGGVVNLSLARTSLQNVGFATGSTIYLVAYGSAVNLASYVDPLTGRFVYPSLNPTPSNVVSFVL
ncbi:carboxypeptidase regulatory-like domain-containing protein [Hymenobacter persicinus]|uniref:Carboxypeptidase regulatory-like domain-containing protein n=1 Tax=Hymenobacter persicinus TaxID=2025506 RepID=A0A4Q5LFN7_9BACT|nr:carboxypeptidase regulatory-like domain-containing protein [Hymenobacter persicinus]RYU83773.1 hypothetical protein EWM57_02175 [Hymenobacter persicinus]